MDEIKDIDISEEELACMGDATDDEGDEPFGGEDNGRIDYCYLNVSDVV